VEVGDVNGSRDGSIFGARGSLTYGINADDRAVHEGVVDEGVVD
jgi:hypothetical protein